MISAKASPIPTLMAILAEYENSSEAVKGIGVAADFLRVNRQIDPADFQEISRDSSLIAGLTSSEMAKLMEKVQDAIDTSVDLLGEMTTDAQEQIAVARKPL